MEAIGRLAGGVAHDFTNVLTAINGHSELALAQLDPADTLYNSIAEIAQAGQQGAALTRQLLAVSRRQMLQPQLLDLNALAADMDKLLRRLIGEDVELHTVLRPALGYVLADPGQMQQVLLNLAVNARDAMPEGGQLTIETTSATLQEPFVHAQGSIPPGRYVVLAVSDTGCGVAPEIQAHLFEPFFTTKAPGKGTGLGLATVYGIIQQSGGYIWLYSERDLGTRVKIYLPHAEDPQATSGGDAPSTPARRGAETILLVEDNDQVRALTRVVLQDHGYTVVEASWGGEALALLAQLVEPVHLLLTDVVMPGVSGRELAERLVSQQPGLRVLYMSGYTHDAVIRCGILDAHNPLLQKPFGAGMLARKVREVLDSPPAPISRSNRPPRETSTVQ